MQDSKNSRRRIPNAFNDTSRMYAHSPVHTSMNSAMLPPTLFGSSVRTLYSAANRFLRKQKRKVRSGRDEEDGGEEHPKFRETICTDDSDCRPPQTGTVCARKPRQYAARPRSASPTSSNDEREQRNYHPASELAKRSRSNSARPAHKPLIRLDQPPTPVLASRRPVSVPRRPVPPPPHDPLAPAHRHGDGFAAVLRSLRSLTPSLEHLAVQLRAAGIKDAERLRVVASWERRRKWLVGTLRMNPFGEEVLKIGLDEVRRGARNV